MVSSRMLKGSPSQMIQQKNLALNRKTRKKMPSSLPRQTNRLLESLSKNPEISKQILNKTWEEARFQDPEKSLSHANRARGKMEKMG